MADHPPFHYQPPTPKRSLHNRPNSAAAEEVKKRKAPSKVSPFWLFAVRECGGTGLKGKALTQYAGTMWPDLNAGQKEKYVEEARRLTAENRASK